MDPSEQRFWGSYSSEMGGSPGSAQRIEVSQELKHLHLKKNKNKNVVTMLLKKKKLLILLLPPGSPVNGSHESENDASCFENSLGCCQNHQLSILLNILFIF